MREPGISVLDPVPPDPTTGVPDCCIPRFDENPERIFIDSEGLAGARGAVGHVERRPRRTSPARSTSRSAPTRCCREVPPDGGRNMSGVPVPVPAADEFTVGGFNIENFAGNDTQETEGGARDPAVDAVARRHRPHRDPRPGDTADAGRPGQRRHRSPRASPTPATRPSSSRRRRAARRTSASS